jgi:chromosome segregation ATPase
MMGMGGRGDPAPLATALAGLSGAMPAQVSGLVALSEFLELLKASGDILPAAVKDLRSVEAMARAACDDLRAATSEYERQLAEIRDRSRQLDERSAVVDGQAATAAQQLTDAAALQASFHDQARALEQTAKELVEREATMNREHAAAMKAVEKLHSDAEQRAASVLADIHRQRQENDAEMQATREKAETEIALKLFEAGAEIARLRTEAQTHLDAAIAREAAVRKHAAELAALSQE